MKKLIATILASVILMLFSSATFVCADEVQPLNKDDILAMDKSELLSTLEDNGLLQPEYFANHPDAAEDFVYDFTHMIMDGTINDYKLAALTINYDQSREMLLSLGGVLEDLGLVPNGVSRISSTSTLQDSTVIGSWNDSYLYYNCYAYSLGKTSGLQPGDLSGTYFNLLMTISEMADVVLDDLASEGYWGYKTTVKPTSLPDEYFRIIAMRKDTNNKDYHFMRSNYGALDTWTHKPGVSQPLKWNYTSPNATIWTNEGIIDRVVYGPSLTYDSDIYYIIYKHKNDPGIQPWFLGGEAE